MVKQYQVILSNGYKNILNFNMGVGLSHPYFHKYNIYSIYRKWDFFKIVD